MNNVRIKRIDYLLIVGLILAPMTGLRLWKIGPAEVLCLIWCLQYYKEFGNLKIRNYVVSFWLIFIFLIILGTGYGLIFYPNESDPIQIMTYIYLMIISFGVYIGMSRKTYSEIDKIMEKISSIGTIWYLLLYLYGTYISTTFLNAPLWYSSRFSGGGINPHQLAVFMSAILFINYRNFLKKKRLIFKFKFLIFIIVCLFISSATNSSTLFASIFITIVLAIILAIVYKGKNKTEKNLLIIFIVNIISLLSVLLFKDIFEKVYNWIQSDPNGIGRLEIFGSIGESLSKNAIFGLGPGIHGFNGLIEYHNTYLEIIAMTGLLGIGVFLLFTKRIFASLKVDYSLCLIIIPLYVYGIAGFTMRRLAFWVILVIVIVIAEKLNYELNQSIKKLQIEKG